MKNICLIENQIRQHKEIEKFLDGYRVIPDEESYQSFIDSVRIFLSEQYGETRMDAAFKEILADLTDKDIHLFVIDYMLVGHEESRTGIDLAESIRKVPWLSHVPILFLSQTSGNNEKVKRELVRIPGAVWVNKGYDEQDILDRDYFKEHVLVKIKPLLEEKVDFDLGVILAEFKTHPPFYEIWPLLEPIMSKVNNGHKPSDKEVRIIKKLQEMKSNGCDGSTEVNEIQNQFKNSI